MNRSIGKSRFEVASHPTNNSYLLFSANRNSGVILCCTLRDNHMIQLCEHCWEIALAKVQTLGLIFKHCNTVCAPFYQLLPCCFLLFLLQKPISTIHITLVSPSLCRTSAPIQITIVFGVLGTQETFYYLVAGLLEGPSSSYASHGLINLRSSTWGKIATFLQNSAPGGPTRVYKNKVA